MDNQTKDKIQKIINTIDELANAEPIMRSEDFNLLRFMTDEPKKLAAYFEEHPELGTIGQQGYSYIKIVCNRNQLSALKEAYKSAAPDSPLLCAYDAKHYSDIGIRLALSPSLR
jgi:hypothetical protein